MHAASDDVAKKHIVHAALNYATMIFSLTNTSIYASLTASITAIKNFARDKTDLARYNHDGDK